MSFKRTRTFEHKPIKLTYSDLVAETEKSGRTYITPEGNRYPSITTILSLRGKGDIQAWRKRVGEEEANRISRHACTRGTAVHTLSERYLNNDEVVLDGTEMPHIKAGFKSIQKILDRSIGKIVLQECPLYSDIIRLAGRVDLIAEYDGQLSVVDFKTSSRVKDESEITNYFVQAAFYAAAFYERTGIAIQQSVIIMVVDGKTDPLVFKASTHSWLPELLTIRAEYEKAKIFGHI